MYFVYSKIYNVKMKTKITPYCIMLLVLSCVVMFCSGHRPFTIRAFSISSKRSSIRSLPLEWNWQHITISDAQHWKHTFEKPLAIGSYTSHVFNQHLSKWCGCCYLVSAVQMLQDRVHIAIGLRNPNVVMQPSIEVDMQHALDTYNQARLENTDDIGWNACKGGSPLHVLQTIQRNKCNLRMLLGVGGTWHGHPCYLDEKESPNSVHLETTQHLQNVQNYIKWRIFRCGPVVLGINAQCINVDDIGERGGMIDVSHTGRPNHAVTVVGWKIVNGLECWIVRNSWGTEHSPKQLPNTMDCVDTGYNNCAVPMRVWGGDPQNPGYVYVPLTFAGIQGIPSPWYDGIPVALANGLKEVKPMSDFISDPFHI